MTPFKEIVDVQHITSNQHGPHLVIIGSIHGNEPIGALALEWLQQFLMQRSLKKGSITLVLGNRIALEKKVRFCEYDLNRLFNKLDSPNKSIEHKRVCEISPILHDADICLDIHTTSSPSEPMTICSDTNEHLSIANIIGTPYIVTNWTDGVVGLASDEFVDQSGGLGFTIECGQHQDKNALSIAKQAIKNVVAHYDMVKVKKSTTKKSLHLKLAHTFYPKSSDFTFLCKSKSFTFLRKNEIYAKDGGTNFIAPYDCYLVMPAKTIIVGVEAGFLAIKV